MALCRISMDTADISKRIKELNNLLDSTAFEFTPDDLEKLCANFSFSESVPTLHAGDTGEVFLRVDFGSHFEDVVSALRTGEADRIAHALDALRALEFEGAGEMSKITPNTKEKAS